MWHGCGVGASAFTPVRDPKAEGKFGLTCLGRLVNKCACMSLASEEILNAAFLCFLVLSDVYV